jgi:competence protein ComEC
LLALGLPVSASGPLANLLAVPWVSLTVPFALLGTLLLPLAGVGEALLSVVGYSLALLFDVLAAIANWQPAWIAVGLPVWALALIGLGVLLLLLPAGIPLRSLGLLLLLPLFLVPTKWVGKKLQSLTRQSFNLNAEMSSTMTERFNVSGAIVRV